MNHIRILAENVASQIAAGEVVERPASVVRELLDNSIDAGARRIRVSVEGGGKREIRVSDDGSGMSRDDLLLCIERHATSKIRSVSDLFAIKTLGFRGEALPSIASVSKMDVTSRPAEDLSGHRLKTAGGRLVSIEEAGCPTGTHVVVRDLFYNVPARKKFLRTPGTEMDRITDTFCSWALPYSEIDFRLESKNQTLLHFPATENQRYRLSTLLGRHVADALLETGEKGDGLEIHAFLAPWEFSRKRGDRIFFYINGRNIRDRYLTRAILEGYGQRLMKGQYPQIAVFMDIDPSQIDVNVHPTKQEVRFHNGRLIFQMIMRMVEKCLSSAFQGFLDSEFRVGGPPAPVPAGEPPQRPFSAPVPFPKEAREIEPRVSKDAPVVIGNLGNTYILCQARDGLLMVDQHAAHERIVYETLKKGLGKGGLQIQTLLIPKELEFSLKEAKILKDNSGLLTRFGIDLEHFGGNTFLLRAIPILLEHVVWEDFLSELVPEIQKDQLQDNRTVDEILTVMACHGAVRAGHTLAPEEMELLLRQLLEMDLPSNCPHGRPIFRHLRYQEIEKMFKRSV
jgi:DNA mismatch repair protein MutL